MIAEVLKLVDGTEVSIDSYLVSHTYEELEGDDYDPRANAFVLNVKHHLAEKVWPSIPTVLLRREFLEACLDRPLPKVAIHAILKSPWRSDESDDGSHLAVLWLQDKEWPLLSQENLISLKSLNWKEHAVDFSI